MEEQRSNWDELVGFHVAFGLAEQAEGGLQLETRAQRHGSPAGQRWNGVAPTELVAWILNEAQSALPATVQPAPPAALEPLLHEPLDLEFVDLTVSQIEMTGVMHSRQLRASGRLRVYDDLPQDSRMAGIRVEFVLHNLDTDERRTAGIERAHMESDELARPIQCDFPIPSAGRYQVRAVVRTLPGGSVMAESPGPVLRVDP